MEHVIDISALSDEDLFFEWKSWFTYYRNKEELPEDDRKYFRELSTAMRDRKLIAPSIPSSSGWANELVGASANG
jgi:hypothetical protein